MLIQPLSLPIGNRFDLPAKTLFLRLYLKNANTKFGIEVYKHHLQVWNGLKEKDPPKQGLEEYLSDFLKIYRAVSSGKFDWERSPVPVWNNQYINGSHRVSAAIIAGKQVATRQANKKEGQLCSYDYLANRKVNLASGLQRVYADAMALEFCRIKQKQQDVFIVTVFSAAQGKNKEVRNILQKCGRIVYSKAVNLTAKGGKALIRQMYNGEKWIGDVRNRFRGAVGKSNPCFAKAGPTRVFLLEKSASADLKVAKDEIRKLYNLGKHSVHINDTWVETMRLARLFFNDNSIHFLNHSSDTYCTYDNFHHLFGKFKKWYSTIDGEDVCIDSSSVMSLYGVREGRDIDFLHHGTISDPKLDKKISSHNSYAHHYPVGISTILYDPRYHFYYNNVKFASLDVVKQMKMLRNEPKDQIDVKLIDDLLKDH